ncbi:hypothetical protein BGZ49_003969 [Haplosporangium sp. Z 27]|nr:hypothetical protein BGZ49_003969 [Haplosporangium sp. Z 27]
MSSPLRKSKRISRSSNDLGPISQVDRNDKGHEFRWTRVNKASINAFDGPNRSTNVDEVDNEDKKENVPPRGSNITEWHRDTVTVVDDVIQRSLEGIKRKKLSRPVQVVISDTQQMGLENPNNKLAIINSSDHNGSYEEDMQCSQKLEPVAKSKHAQEEMSEYGMLLDSTFTNADERQRLENIRKNQEMLRFLELPSAATNNHTVLMGKKRVDKMKSVAEDHPEASAPVKARRAYLRKTNSKNVQPARVSNRLRGLAVSPLEIGENDSLDLTASHSERDGGGISQDGAKEKVENDSENTTDLMSGDLFFDQETRDKAIRVDGHYKGWLNSCVMERYGFEKSAQEAWEANGGGEFSFRDPLGHSDGATSSRSSKRQKHDAKMVARAMFKKNPNAFFYRHNEPGQDQWTGDWTEEEGKLFLRVAEEFGCGDKWGLFASHIPHRVGYQCSNYYRQVVIPQGLVFDPNYEYTSRGKPIYCGKYNQRRN